MVHVKDQVAVWRSLIDLIQSQKYWMQQIAEDFGITPQMAIALKEVPPAGGTTMKKLAGQLFCDASNATGIVDRLESRGYVERRPHENDRRVKCVALTAAGRRLRRKLDDRLALPPPAIAALSDTDQEQLGAILERALILAQRQREERES